MEFFISKYENGTISLIIQETIPWRIIFKPVAGSMKGIILKSEVNYHISLNKHMCSERGNLPIYVALSTADLLDGTNTCLEV